MRNALPISRTRGLIAGISLLALAVACGAPQAPMHPDVPADHVSAPSLALPGATGPVTVDYVGYEPVHHRVWVPVGETGSVDVYDIGKGSFTRVDGFKTAEREARGKKRMMGPSSVTFGPGTAYVGDRASGEICAVDADTLKLGACVTLSSPPDGLAFVAATNEVWATTPREQSITVLDASTPDALRPKAVIKTEGDPEGYAVDEERGLFYTNLEDKNRTLAVDLKAHTVKASWAVTCPKGPRGVAAERQRHFVYVACTDGVLVLDADHGAQLGKLDTGDGVDDFRWSEKLRRLYVAARDAARLTVAQVDDHGAPSVVSTTALAPGSRNAVVDGDGTVYVVDPNGARLQVVTGR